MRRTFLFLAAPCFAFAAVFLGASREAHAGLAIALDGHAGPTINDPTGTSRFGGGVSARLGLRLDIIQFEIGPLFITPEIGGGYWFYGQGDQPGRVFGGGRLGLGTRFQPSIFGHAGYGLVRSVDNYRFEGFTADGGAALEFQIVPTFGIGVHASYVTNRYLDMGVEQSLNWFDFGLQMTVNL